MMQGDSKNKTNVGGIIVSQQKTGTMFRVQIGGMEHAIAISTPERNEVAIVTAGEPVAISASIRKIVGSGLHGKVESPGVILLNNRLHLKKISGGKTEETAPVEYIAPISQLGNASAMQIIVAADQNVADMLDSEMSLFEEKDMVSVRSAVYAFGNYGGRIAAIKTLRAAREKGKLKRALKIFGINWNAAVKNQSPLFAGDPEVNMNMECWKYFCQTIGIPLPNF